LFLARESQKQSSTHRKLMCTRKPGAHNTHTMQILTNFLGNTDAGESRSSLVGNQERIPGKGSSGARPRRRNPFEEAKIQ
jgi:hypothetical protein